MTAHLRAEGSSHAAAMEICSDLHRPWRYPELQETGRQNVPFTLDF